MDKGIIIVSYSSERGKVVLFKTKEVPHHSEEGVMSSTEAQDGERFIKSLNASTPFQYKIAVDNSDIGVGVVDKSMLLRDHRQPITSTP